MYLLYLYEVERKFNYFFYKFTSKYVLILLIEFDARKPKKVIQIHITHVAFADSLFEHYIYVLLLKVGVTVAKMDTFMPPKMNACSSLSRNMNNPTDTNCLCPL